MPRQSQYTEDQKAKIIQTATAAKKKGTWQDALSAAKEAGFKGGLPYLMVMVRGKGKKGGGGGRRGRPRKSAVAGVSAARVGGGLSEIERIVRAEVDRRLKAARAAAIQAFDRALG